MEITQVYIERARELGRRATRLVLLVFQVSLDVPPFISIFEPEKPNKPAIHTNKNEQDMLLEMTLSKSTGEHLTARRIRGIIRYGRPMCGRLRYLLNHG